MLKRTGENPKNKDCPIVQTSCSIEHMEMFAACKLTGHCDKGNKSNNSYVA